VNDTLKSPAELTAELAAARAQIEALKHDRAHDGEDPLGATGGVYALVDGLTQSLYRTDLQGRVTFANARYCQVMGRTRAELLGKTAHDLFPEDLASKYQDDDRKVLETREPLEMVEEHRLPGGDMIYVQVIKTPVFDLQGRVVGMQAMFWDVTERKLYQEMLERLAAIVEASDDAIIGTTVEGIILSWNPGAERLYGYTTQEAIGKRIDLVIPNELRDEMTAVKERMEAGERISHFETVRRRKDGKKVDVALSLAPIHGPKGAISGVSCIARDISDRRRAEYAVDQLAAIVQSSFDAIIGHTLEGEITTWNPAAERLYGYKAEEVLGKSITMLSPAERQDELFLLVGRVAREEQIRNFPTVHVAKDGRKIEISLSVSPIIDAELDRVTGISIIAHAVGGN